MKGERLTGMERVAFFGASVTEQQNGYVEHFSKKWRGSVKKYGYGGMHIIDAGMCFIDEVLESRPSVVFIDWFSTGYKECTARTAACIDTFLFKFGGAGCAVVFLMFPERKDALPNEEKYEFHSYVKKLLEERGAQYVDVASSVQNGDLPLVLRDSIHTTPHGAELYAEKIYEAVLKRPPRVISGEMLAVCEKNAFYKDIRCTSVERAFGKRVDFSLDSEIVGILHTVGRHSGLVRVGVNGRGGVETLLWDRWCHYTRRHFALSQPHCTGGLRIEILQDGFDTTACKIPVDFSRYKKKLMLHSVYWIGTRLEITNLREGKRLPLWRINAVRLCGKVVHRMARFLHSASLRSK